MSAILMGFFMTAFGQSESEKKATADFQLLLDEKYGEMVSRFDATMSQHIDEPRLEQLWQGLLAQLGEFEEILAVNAQPKGEYTRNTLTCSFGSGYLKALITYDSKGLIAGLFFSPEKVQRNYEMPEYVVREKFSELEFNIRHGQVSLPAVLSLPNEGVDIPLVILVHGSGPLDRDLSIEQLKPFRDLAWGLASRGIGVLRYDKRTFIYGASTSDVSGGPVTPYSETIEDVVQALEMTSEFERIDQKAIYVFGHSLGATLASGIEEAANIKPAGYVLSAGSPRALEKIILEQCKYIYSLDGLSQKERSDLKEMKRKVKRVRRAKYDNQTPAIDLPLGVGPAYWSWLKEYDPTSALRSSSARLLVLQAEKDYQVTKKDLKAWKRKLKKRAEYRSYERLFHPLVETKARALARPEDYSTSGHVPAYVIIDLAEWIRKL